MLEVITDTSPIQYLYQIAQLDLLPSLPDPASLSWITLCSVHPSCLIPDQPDLGAGEREALSLAITIPASLVILDDALARNYAQQLQIAMTGTLGILLKGKQSGYVEAIAPLLEKLDTLNFRLAPATRAAVLKLANESTLRSSRHG
jgi:uncharacterized protein